MTCIECGASCAGEFCCRAHEDLWTYGPSVQPGHSILRVEMGNTQPGEPGKRSKPKKWQGVFNAAFSLKPGLKEESQ